MIDLILTNGRLRALDGVLPATALAVEDGRIAAMGGDEQLRALAGERTQVIDLGGRTVYAGFGDSHMHLLHFGVTLNEAELKDAHSMEEAIELIRAFIRRNEIPAGRTVYAHGWNQDLFPDKRIPTARDLDAASAEHPIVASRICGHLATANTLALKKFGITGERAVAGGEIYLDAHGEPTGVVSENAVSLLYAAQEDVSVQEAADILKKASAYAASRGITCVHSDDLTSMAGCRPETVIAAYRDLAKRDELMVRVYEQCMLPDAEAIERFFQDGYAPGQRTGAFALESLKIIADGSLGGRTAYLRAPYRDAPETRGMLCHTPEEIHEMVLAAHRRGMPVAIHAIGDAAMEICLDAIAQAQRAAPEKQLRHGIVHCQITDAGLLDRFAALGVQAYVQPVFLEYDAHMVEDRVGEVLAETSYNWKGLLQRGVNVSGGSDCPVEGMDSLKNIYCAMARADFEGWPEGGWNPAQKLTAQEALRVFTRNVAAASGDEGRRGDLKIGYDADLTVLNEDFFDVDLARILEIAPFMTVMGGKIRFMAQA